MSSASSEDKKKSSRPFNDLNSCKHDDNLMNIESNSSYQNHKESKRDVVINVFNDELNEMINAE